VLAFCKLNFSKGAALLKYCAWCGKYQGAIAAKGYQIRENISEIDTATICPSCMAKLMKEMGQSRKGCPLKLL
jgi:hypothetical protein